VEEPGDAELVLRARDGDRAAFGVLVRRHQRSIHGIGLRFLRNEADADDLVQETFLRAWNAIDRFDPERPLLPWLRRIATNWALNRIDASKRHGEEEWTDTMPSPQRSAEEDLDRARLQRKVKAALDGLPPDQRMILTLRAHDGLSYREIADTLDVPIGTVMSRLARARETMRKRVPRGTTS
jgi:RNA polymerase sigma-70 factor (ECF subfamily)